MFILKVCKALKINSSPLTKDHLKVTFPYSYSKYRVSIKKIFLLINFDNNFFFFVQQYDIIE